jgi:YD repeat-containing protein
MSLTSKLEARSRRPRIPGGGWGAALLLVLLATTASVAGTTRYQYDPLGRLVRVELPNGHMIEYVYDPAGNILQTRDPVLDDDGDGDPNVSDCDPDDPTVHPGAPEINDGKDNQCPGDPGYGLVDEIMGPLVFDSETMLSWPGQQGATMYEIARSKLRTFASGCWKSYSPETALEVTQAPAVGEGHYYLVRPYMPYAGSWGANSAGSGRTVCP